MSGPFCYFEVIAFPTSHQEWSEVGLSQVSKAARMPIVTGSYRAVVAAAGCCGLVGADSNPLRFLENPHYQIA